MPENHDRNKEKTELVFRRECPGTEYELPLFESNTSCAGARCLGSDTKVISSIGVDVSNGKLLNNTPITQQTVTNATQDWLDLNQKKACFTRDARDIQGDDEVLNHESVRISQKSLDGDENIVERLHSVVSTGKELSDGELFTGKEDSTITKFENGLPKQSISLAIERRKIAVVDQEASEIVCETLRPMNEVLGLDSERAELEGYVPYSINQETQLMLKLPNLDKTDTEKAELNTLQDIACSKKDSLRETQRSTTTAQIATHDISEINPIFHDAPLIFPETSNIAISKPSISSVKKENMRASRNTPCLSDVESGITRNTTEIKQSDLIDTCRDNPSESSLADANTQQQLHIVVKTHPDGGWGWVVCLGAFLVQFIALGMQNTAGIVYTELVKELKSQRGATGWPYVLINLH